MYYLTQFLVTRNLWVASLSGRWLGLQPEGLPGAGSPASRLTQWHLNTSTGLLSQSEQWEGERLKWKPQPPVTQSQRWHTITSAVCYWSWRSTLVKWWNGRRLHRGVKTRRWRSLGPSWRLPVTGMTSPILLRRSGCSESFSKSP